MSGSISFSYTGKIVTFTAPTTGTYDIEAIRGSGGNGPTIAQLRGALP